MLLDIVVGVVLGAWLAVTVVAHLRPRTSRLRCGAWGALIPEWRFFAPRPASHDYAVFVRVRLNDNSATEPAVLPALPRRVTDVLWNPWSRLRKAQRDAIEALLRAATQRRAATDTIVESPEYQSLLALAQDAVSLSEIFQFGVLVVEGTKEDRIAFISRWHTAYPPMFRTPTSIETAETSAPRRPVTALRATAAPQSFPSPLRSE